MHVFCNQPEKTMPTLTVRDVPSAVHERLKRQAQAHNRSLNGELLELLERAATGQSSEERRSLLDELRSEQAATPAWNVDPDTLKQKMREGLA